MKKLNTNIKLSGMFFIFTTILLVRMMSGALHGWRLYFIPIAFIICCTGMIYNLLRVLKKN